MNSDRPNSEQLYIVQSALMSPQERENKIVGLHLAQPYPNLASVKYMKTSDVCRGHLDLYSCRTGAQGAGPTHTHGRERDGAFCLSLLPAHPTAACEAELSSLIAVFIYCYYTVFIYRPKRQRDLILLCKPFQGAPVPRRRGSSPAAMRRAGPRGAAGARTEQGHGRRWFWDTSKPPPRASRGQQALFGLLGRCSSHKSSTGLFRGLTMGDLQPELSPRGADARGTEAEGPVELDSHSLPNIYQGNNIQKARSYHSRAAPHLTFLNQLLYFNWVLFM